MAFRLGYRDFSRIMKFRPKTPPVAMPFSRGKRPVRPLETKTDGWEWIGLPVWSALAAEGTDAHRIASGPDIWLERFGPDVLISYQTTRARDAVLAEIEARCAVYSYEPRRIFGKSCPSTRLNEARPPYCAVTGVGRWKRKWPRHGRSTDWILRAATRPVYSSTNERTGRVCGDGSQSGC